MKKEATFPDESTTVAQIMGAGCHDDSSVWWCPMFVGFRYGIVSCQTSGA
jgi:hypothetical protein